VDVVWNPDNPTVATAVWTTSTGTCSNLICHGNSSARWGDNGCAVCHVGTTDVPVFMSSDGSGNVQWDSVKNNHLAGKITLANWTSSGHGKRTGAYLVSGNQAAGLTGTRGCEYCHDPSVGHATNYTTELNPMRLRNQTDPIWGMNGVCQSCHARGGTTVTIGTLPAVAVQTRISSYHYGSKHNVLDNNGGQWCWDCHNPHGYNANIFMINDRVARNSNSSRPGQPKQYGFGSPGFANAVFTAASSGSNYVKHVTMQRVTIRLLVETVTT
jgi:hypothetical protein